MFSKNRSLGTWLEKFCGSKYRRKTTSSKNNNLSSRAETIKRLNKENKSLFGKLLDRPATRAKKVLPRVEVNSITSKSNPKTSDRGKKSADGIKKDKHKTKPPLLVAEHFVTDNHHINVISPEQLFEVIDDRPRPMSETSLTFAEENFFGQQSTSKPGPNSTEKTTDVLLVPPYYKTKQLILPDIIIRNITSFPLLNKEKDVEHVPSFGQSILNITRNNSEYYSYPSVNKILNATMSDASRTALDRWKKNMIAELGEEGFEEFYQGQLLRGSQFHSIVESFLFGATELAVTPELEGCWHSLSSVVPDITNVRAVESHVVHPKLMYRGVIDCVAEYKGKLALIEWKKSDKLKPEIGKTYDAPLQMSAYLGALNYDQEYNFQLRRGVVVVAYTDGTPAQVFPVALTECTRYWGWWLKRLYHYWLQQQNTVMAVSAARSTS